MKVKLKSSEQLNMAFCELRDRLKIVSEEEERHFAMFKKIIRGNVEFDENHVENKMLAEKEELCDQKIIEIAFKRRELTEKCKKDYEENNAAVLREIGGISTTLDEGKVFSLRDKKHELDRFENLVQRVKGLKERMPGVAAKVDRAKKVLEDESRRSIGIGDTASYNPVKMYFDLK